jgi:hypothetical protein
MIKTFTVSYYVPDWFNNLFVWLNSLPQYQQMLIGIPSAIILAWLFLWLYNKFNYPTTK